MRMTRVSDAETTGLEGSDMTEVRNAGEGDSLVEGMYPMLDHLNGAAWEESKGWTGEGREWWIFIIEDEEMS